MASRDVKWTGFSMGAGGWVRLTGIRPFVLVRFVDNEGQLEVDEMYLEGRVTAYLLKGLEPGPIEMLANRPDVARKIRYRLNEAAPDLRRAAGYFSHGLGGSTYQDGRGWHWVHEMFLAQFLDEPRPRKAPDPIVLRQSAMRQAPMASDAVSERIKRSRPSGKVAVPTDRTYPDSFYEAVGITYSGLVAAGERAPNKTIAEANGVRKTTADRWIRQAREKGLLAPAAGAGRVG
jgi:hypothetical protein